MKHLFLCLAAVFTLVSVSCGQEATGKHAFPVVGKFYSITFAAQERPTNGFSRDTVKILAAADGGWFFVEYALPTQPPAGGTSPMPPSVKMHAWINFAFVVSATETAEPK